MAELRKGEHQTMTLGKYTLHRHDYDGKMVVCIDAKRQLFISEDRLEKAIDDIDAKYSLPSIPR